MKKFLDQIRLKQLVSFDIQLSHDFSGNESKNLKRTYATLIFKISEVDGTTRTRVKESMPYFFVQAYFTKDAIEEFR